MNFNDIVFFEKEVIGTVGSSPGDMEATVMLLNQGKIDPSSLVSETIKLDNVTYEMLSTRCKKKHKKPIDWITHLIQEDDNNGK